MRTRSIMLVIASLLCLMSLSAVQAQTTAVPGRSVGHVFLGMDRADVWKILGKPSHTATVPHGMSLYGEDDWSNSKHTLTVVSERDKVIQIEFDSPRITTTDGLSTQSFWSQVRRRHPSMTIRDYVVLYKAADYQTGTSSFYIDDVHRGIAFTLETQESVEPQYINTARPDQIIIHRPGYRAVPINEGRWSAAIPNDDPDSMRVIQRWFTPHRADTQTPPYAPLPVADFEQAPHRIAPGQGVDGVRLGTSRADVWRQLLRKPSFTEVVSHGAQTYTADLWERDAITITIVFEQDKAVQIGFNNINYMTDEGDLIFLSLAKLRRQHPAMTVSCYDLNPAGDVIHQYYMDDIRQGIAFLYSTGRNITPWELESCVDTILVHRPGTPALPIYNKHWSTREPPTEDPNGLRQMRAWFTLRKQ